MNVFKNLKIVFHVQRDTKTSQNCQVLNAFSNVPSYREDYCLVVVVLECFQVCRVALHVAQIVFRVRVLLNVHNVMEVSIFKVKAVFPIALWGITPATTRV